MDIFKYDVYRGPNIGIYANVNDEHIFLPRGFAKTKANILEKYLGVNSLFTSVSNTRLIGAMMAINNHGLLLPKTCLVEEYELAKKSTDLNVAVLESKYTALGNLICTNDKGAIVSPIIPKLEVKKIEDILGVEVIQKKIAGYHQVGAMAVATSGGAIIHPETDEEDIKIFSNVLGVRIEPATINGGVPYVMSGVLANNNAIVVGSFTVGPEIMMLTRAFIN